jgi:hypothetical protein
VDAVKRRGDVLGDRGFVHGYSLWPGFDAITHRISTHV